MLMPKNEQPRAKTPSRKDPQRTSFLFSSGLLRLCAFAGKASARSETVIMAVKDLG
jgi:hypothetical protein